MNARRIRHRTLTALATLVSASALMSVTPAVAAPARVSAASQAPNRSDAVLRTLLNDVVDAGVPGVMVRVQDGREIRRVAAGVADVATGAPLPAGARFRVGSITKTFVSTVMLQLVGERRLSLDEPVGRWLPGLLIGDDSVTPRQLLNHTSGLFDYAADPAVLEGIVANRVFDPRELVAIAETHPRWFTPGAAWAYSNTDSIVAGLLIEAVTRHGLAGELRQRVFEPLGLEETEFPVATAQNRGSLAHGYLGSDLVPTPDGRPFDVTEFNPSHAWAAGAIVSNARDLSRFYRALMGGRLLAPHLLREMKTTVAEDPADPNSFRYGLGIERVQDPCGANWGHSGAIFGYRSMAYWNEQTGRMVVIASTMFPSPPSAEPAITEVTDFALCGLLLRQRSERA